MLFQFSKLCQTMPCRNGIIFIFIFISFLDESKAADSSCADWEPYKDEKCFKILDDTLRTFDDAVKNCGKLEDNPTLSIIRSRDEQDFLTNYVFKTQKKVDNVWIGAKFASNAFHWVDNTELSFTNWDSRSQKNRTNYCIQMQSEEIVAGKWIDEPCEKKNLVVCQKLQSWSTVRLQKVLLDSRKELRDSLDSQKREFETFKQIVFPIGFTYAQLPKEKSPSEIWPWMNWTDVSPTYAGVFFRVNGGGAAAFGQVQEENAPRLTQVRTGGPPTINHPTMPWSVESPIPKTGWSHGIPTGEGCCTEWTVFTAFEHSGGEIRPRNMAIRVWKRID